MSEGSRTWVFDQPNNLAVFTVRQIRARLTSGRISHTLEFARRPEPCERNPANHDRFPVRPLTCPDADTDAGSDTTKTLSSPNGNDRRTSPPYRERLHGNCRSPSSRSLRATLIASSETRARRLAP